MAITLVKTYKYQGELIVEECCICGVTFGMQRGLWDECDRDSTRYFYCPNGHAQHYAKSREQRLARELEQVRDALAASRAMTAQAERSRSALRGVVTRERNRIARGLCPRCNREFPDVAKHMAMLHAGFEAEDPEVSDAGNP